MTGGQRHSPATDTRRMGWHTETIESVYDELDTATEGLTDEQARERRAEWGPNEITTGHGRGPLRIFLAQFSSALIWVLLAAVAISVAIGHLVDATLIAVILLANGVFGFVQEYRAEQSLDALRELTRPDATVRRAGEKRVVDVTRLVPGDVVVLEQGDVVPADCRIVEARALEVDEAALTGESVPVEKETGTTSEGTPLAERSNVLYKGTSVTRGRAVAVVVSLALQLAVLYTPLREYFGTVPLSLADWGVLAGTLAAGAPLVVAVGWLVKRGTVADRQAESPSSDTVQTFAE
ncbi:MAG: cation-translocating P-type ATPase [Haloarculaceae archaeon]